MLRKFEFDVAPLLLAVVLGDRMELAFRRSLTISGGDYSIFVTGTIPQVLAGVLVLQSIAWLFGFRKRMLTEAEDAPPPAINDRSNAA